MKKKRYGLFIMGLMILLLCSLGGCGRMTPERLLKEAMENSKKAKSFEGDLAMDMKMKMAQSGMTMEMGAEMNLDIAAVNEPAAYHMKGDIALDVMGLSMEVEMYGEEKDGQNINYNYKSEDDKWIKTVEGKTEDDEMDSIMFDLDTIVHVKDKLKLADKTEENGKEVYVITTEISGGEITDMLEATGNLMAEMGSDFDFSGTKADVTIKVYRESRLPASIEVKIDDPIVAEIDEPDGMQMSLENFNYSIHFKEYDTVEKIEIPKEALRAEEIKSSDDFLDDLAEEESKDEYDTSLTEDEDGNYILTNWDNIKEVKITTPKGYEISKNSSTCYSIYFKNAELDEETADSFSATYRIKELDEDETEENLLEDFDWIRDEVVDDQSYRNVSEQKKKEVKVGKNTVSYASFSYDYKDITHEDHYLAWMMLSEGFVLTCNFDRYTDYGVGSPIDENTVFSTLFEGVSVE